MLGSKNDNSHAFYEEAGCSEHPNSARNCSSSRRYSDFQGCPFGGSAFKRVRTDQKTNQAFVNRSLDVRPLFSNLPFLPTAPRDVKIRNSPNVQGSSTCSNGSFYTLNSRCRHTREREVHRRTMAMALPLSFLQSTSSAASARAPEHRQWTPSPLPNLSIKQDEASRVFPSTGVPDVSGLAEIAKKYNLAIGGASGFQS